jgi:hypothetical protein
MCAVVFALRLFMLSAGGELQIAGGFYWHAEACVGLHGTGRFVARILRTASTLPPLLEAFVRDAACEVLIALRRLSLGSLTGLAARVTLHAAPVGHRNPGSSGDPAARMPGGVVRGDLECGGSRNRGSGPTQIREASSWPTIRLSGRSSG